MKIGKVDKLIADIMTYDTINDAVTMKSGDGSTLGRIDKYELVRELGEGGFGAVFLAKDTVAGTDVAIKGLPPEVKHNNAELEGIRANFALVKRLRHPNIVAVTDLHQALAVNYASKEVEAKLRVFPQDTMVVMDYAPGATLAKWRRQFPGGMVPIDVAVSVVRQVASALDYAHGQKVLHRDVKPANVIVETGDDGGLTARVLDFGLAAEIRSSMGRLSREIRDTSGTRPYMAPEQWLGHRQGPATDQYALAVMLYELLVGEVPFASVFDCGDPVVMRLAVTTDAPDIPADLPKGVRRALAKALAKKPEERFASCADFVATLEGKGFSRKGRKGVGKVVGVLALLAVFGVGGYYGWTKYYAHVRAVEAEDARIAAAKNAAEASVKQKVFELVGEASRARDDNAGAEWRDWPHFSVKAKELEESYQGGRTALEGGDYPAASNQFARVCDTWRWLLSNKVERLKAVSSREKAKEGMDAAKKAEAARWNGEGWHAATNLHAQAHEFFDRGDFPSAKNMSDAAVSAFANSLAAANAERAAYEKRVEEEKRKKEAERKIADEKARMEAAAKKKAEVWGECLGLKLEVPAAERAETTRVLVEESRKGWFFNSSFIDYRRADWSNAYILLGLGRFAETKKDGWSPNYPVSLAFYEKSLESGCTNAAPAVERIARKLRNKPYFDAIESCDMQRIKDLIGKDQPQLTV
ncbi:MAG: serine/threonine protein kinase, partial [Kiritimatiellae bacterium]|nr:serine/threonine protein kinase [Kiritimatiellia bacterium]